jgi:hypothetical protein
MTNFFYYIGFGSTVVLVGKIIWNVWVWVLSVNSWMESTKRMTDNHITRITHLENWQHECQLGK